MGLSLVPYPCEKGTCVLEAGTILWADLSYKVASVQRLYFGLISYICGKVGKVVNVLVTNIIMTY